MKAVLFGATGMVGQGVLRECLLDPEVESVLSVGRSTTAQRHTKLRELVHRDFTDVSAIEADLTGFDAGFFCLGVSSVGMAETDYRRITYDITMVAGRTLARLNPGMTFTYVSGMGTDASERGRVMWARVKGETENALQRLPFKAAYMFRPAGIRPVGIVLKKPLYRIAFGLTAPLWPFLEARFPKYVTTTERLGRAMIAVARDGYVKPILDSLDINRF